MRRIGGAFQDQHTMIHAQAYCPASLSFIFKACPNTDITKAGSTGVGCTVDKGVTASVTPSLSGSSIVFNGKPITFPTVERSITLITTFPVTINLTSSLPLGYGFGISGAAALSSVLAVNKLFNLKRSKAELTLIAHRAEIENGTGLGSVGTQTTGGFIIKKSPGIPVDDEELPFFGKNLYAITVDKLETPTILQNNDHLKKINDAADCALSKIAKISGITLEQMIDISYQFAKDSHLLNNSQVHAIIGGIKKTGGHATMAMLGQTIISTVMSPINVSDIPVKLTITRDTAKTV